MADDGFSFQTGPGRIVVGAFVPSDGPGLPADRVREEKDASPKAVPLRLLSPNIRVTYGRDARVVYIDPEQTRYHAADVFRVDCDCHYCSRHFAPGRYVDPEQTASRTRHWDDAA